MIFCPTLVLFLKHYYSQSYSLLIPSAITSTKSAVEVMSTLSRILREKGTAAFYIDELFPTLGKLIWPNLNEREKDSEYCIGPRTRKSTEASEYEELSSKHQTFYGYDMTRDLDSALGKVSTIQYKYYTENT